MDNAQIAKSLRKIRHLLQKQGEDNKFRLMAYSNAANTIDRAERQLKDVLAEGEPAFHAYCNELGRVGEKSRAKILQLINTGTCEELKALEALEPPPSSTQESFMDLLGEDGQAPAPTKRKASKNLREEVTAVRRPREQAQEVVDRVTTVVSKYFAKVMVCGSWRRGLPTVKDIDIALTEVRPEYQDQDVQMLFTRIEKELGIEEHNVVKRGQAQTAFYHPSSSGDWHVDFWYIPSESWGAAILFATGSADFNVSMRGWLKARGFMLNRYGLYNRTADNRKGDVVAQRTEEEIFEALGLRFVEPKDRIDFNANTMRKAS